MSYILGREEDWIRYWHPIVLALYTEISMFDKSIYYDGSHGKFANSNDFNFALLKSDYLNKYPQIEEKDIGLIMSDTLNS